LARRRKTKDDKRREEEKIVATKRHKSKRRIIDTKKDKTRGSRQDAKTPGNKWCAVCRLSGIGREALKKQ